MWNERVNCVHLEYLTKHSKAFVWLFSLLQNAWKRSNIYPIYSTYTCEFPKFPLLPPPLVCVYVFSYIHRRAEPSRAIIASYHIKSPSRRQFPSNKQTKYIYLNTHRKTTSRQDARPSAFWVSPNWPLKNATQNVIEKIVQISTALAQGARKGGVCQR